jgi:hypothetical protein
MFSMNHQGKTRKKDSGSTFLWYSVALTFPFQAQHLLEPPRLSQGGSPGDPRAQGRREGQSCWNREASWCSSFKRIKRHKIQFCHLELVMNYTHLGFMVGFSSLAYDIYCSAFDSSLWESQPRDREVGARPLCWGPCMWRDDPPQRNPLQSDQLELSLASLECAGTGRALASFDVRSLKNLIRLKQMTRKTRPLNVRSHRNRTHPMYEIPLKVKEKMLCRRWTLTEFFIGLEKRQGDLPV